MSGFAGQQKGLGVDVTFVDAAPGTGEPEAHQLGEIVYSSDPDLGHAAFQYVKVSGTITAGRPVSIDENFQATASGNGGRIDGVAPVAFADTERGWVQIEGKVTDADAETNVSKNDLLSLIADANGDFIAVLDVDESGSDTMASGALHVRARALEDDTAGSADVWLYRL